MVKEVKELLDQNMIQVSSLICQINQLILSVLEEHLKAMILSLLWDPHLIKLVQEVT